MKLAPSPAGAYLSSSQTGGSSTSKQIVFNTIDNSSPYTRLASGIVTLEMAGPVTVTAQAVMSSTYAATITLQINGATVATGTNANTSTLSYAYTAKTGDQLAIWQTDNGFGLASVNGGATTTFIHIIPAGAPNFTGLPVPLQRASLH